MEPATKSRSRRIVIMGAAGRDFHNFNVVYRSDASARVVSFTAAQIPGIANRRYPAALAGPLYPEGIPIVEEERLAQLVRDERIDEVIFAYSDVSHETVMHHASTVLAAGADFRLLGPLSTMLESQRPVVAVSAVRTGVGKSQVSRWLSGRLRGGGLRVAVLRHPMPYGDLARQAVQRFANTDDLDRADCTLEEREEYEPHIAAGGVVYAGVDYAAILAAAEKEADLILWDGGNNDFPFLRPDLHLVLVDPLRAGHERAWHPGEAVLRMADVVVVAKSDAASAAQIAQVEASAGALAPGAAIVRARSAIRLDPDENLAGRRVVVVEERRARPGRASLHRAPLRRVRWRKRSNAIRTSVTCCRPWAIRLARSRTCAQASWRRVARPWSAVRRPTSVDFSTSPSRCSGRDTITPKSPGASRTPARGMGRGSGLSFAPGCANSASTSTSSRPPAGHID
jgi:predicted GTPase